MEEKKNSPGIFYAVVGVATLIVAIIGATFAYFTAMGASNNTTVKGSTLDSVSVSLNVNKVHPVTGDTGYTSSSKMIPLETGEANEEDSEIEATSKMADAISHKCVDTNGNEACQIYKATIKNESDSATTKVTTTLKLTDLGTLEHMRWQVLNGTSFSDFTVTGSVISNHNAPSPLNSSETLETGESATYYFIVWLEETGADQTTEMAQTFGGLVSANIVTESGTVTAQTTATFSS